MKQIKQSRKAGFTLVEIMIVVAIIGLLAAIAIPNFVKARATSQQNACINNMRQITAAVIWRMLLMQAFCCEVARAFTKLGIAMAASKPMMATTIIISTSVKPALRDCFMFFILLYVLSVSELRWNLATGGLYDCIVRSLNCL